MATFRKRSGKWNARIQRKGLPDLSKTFVTRTDAEAWARATEAEIDRGSFIDRTEAERSTLADILERYKREISPQKKAGDVEAIRINKFIRDESISGYKATALSGKLLSEWRDKRLTQVSGSSVNRELNLISHAVNIARKEWGIHIENPVQLIRRPKLNKARERRLAGAELTLLLDGLALSNRRPDGSYAPGGCRNYWVKPIVCLALETAMRMGELVDLKWANIDLQKRVARLDDTKNGEDRLVPLSTTAIGILMALPRSIDGLVFSTTREAVKRAFHRACLRVGIRDLHFHDLRHEATSRLFEKGLNVMEVSTITGHKTLSMLKRYTHLKAEDLALKLG